MKKSTLQINSKTIFYFLFSILSLPSATAGPVDGLRQLTEGAREMLIILIQFITDILFDIESFDQLLFAKILIFALILLIAYTVVKENTLFSGKKNRAIQWIIAIAVSILSVRFLPDEFVLAILLQYNALAIGLGLFLPMSIYFFFIHQSGIGPFGRKVAWIIYIIAFASLWYIRYDDLAEANTLYWIALILMLIALIFDKVIHKYFSMRGMRKLLRKSRSDQHRHWKRELLLLEEDYRRGVIDENQYNKERPILEQRIRDTA